MLALEQDFVSELGLLEDRNSPAKLPGVSIDNGAYHEVEENIIDQNYGGGVKMVRTTVYNLIGLNAITDNNKGVSTGFHFFGIELGSAMADASTADLDFAPSRGNQIVANTIRGGHYAGIFLGNGSDTNDILDNSIFDATNWAIESVKPQLNASLNNLTNLKLRNISSGLDPALLMIGKGELDTPTPHP